MLDYVRRSIIAQGKGFLPFLMVTRERQAASCLVATRRYLEEGIRTKRDAIWHEGASTALDEDDDDGSRSVTDLAALQELATISQEIGEQDSKFDQLNVLLSDLLTESRGSKVLVFSFFRRTIQYLEERLAKLGFTVYVIHGGKNPAERQSAMERFAAISGRPSCCRPRLDAEGLDFQFCDIDGQLRPAVEPDADRATDRPNRSLWAGESESGSSI